MLCSSDLTIPIFYLVLLILVCSSIIFFFRYTFLKAKSSLVLLHKAELRKLQLTVATLESELVTLTENYDHCLLKTREIRSQLVFSKKMTELGKLVSGIAHELNNPISAIKASAETVSEITSNEIGEIQKSKQIFQSLDDSEMNMLIRVISKNSNESIVMGYKERKEKIKTLKSILEKYSYEYESDDIESFLDVGLEAPDETDLMILSHKNQNIKPYILSIRNLRQHLKIIEIGVDRAASLLLALKKFTRNSVNHEEKHFQLVDNIETVLSIYQYQLRGKISLTKMFLTDAVMVGHPEELFQVWTNIILNAIQAMDSKGNLSIHIQRMEPNKVMVKIIDNGPGIPEEIQNRIFLSQFSTKEIGEGSGMGLAITREIIENHKGKIAVDSVPGKTEFLITLPVAEFLDYPV